MSVKSAYPELPPAFAKIIDAIGFTDVDGTLLIPRFVRTGNNAADALTTYAPHLLRPIMLGLLAWHPPNPALQNALAGLEVEWENQNAVTRLSAVSQLYTVPLSHGEIQVIIMMMMMDDDDDYYDDSTSSFHKFT